MKKLSDQSLRSIRTFQLQLAGQWNVSEDNDFEDFWIFEEIEVETESLLKAICREIGHDPITDQCRRPEHDLCSYCRERLPGQAKREHLPGVEPGS